MTSYSHEIVMKDEPVTNARARAARARKKPQMGTPLRARARTLRGNHEQKQMEKACISSAPFFTRQVYSWGQDESNESQILRHPGC